MLLDTALSVALGGLFFLSGGTKLAGVRKIAAQFERWRYPPSVRIAGGAMEVAGAALLLVPGLTLYGAAVLLAVLVTAVYTHVVREGGPRNATPAAVLLVLVVLLVWLRGGAAYGPAGAIFQAVFG